MLNEPPEVVDHDVFVVHADDDAPFVKGELLPMLHLPDDRVILSSELPFPAFTEQAIARSVRRSRLTLAVVSPAYLRDRWAGFAELLSRNANDDGGGGRLVPLLLVDCEVPAILAQHQTLDARTAPQWEASAARLRARLGRADPPVEQLACPYPGMQPFSAATASQFHGRASEIDELLARLQAGERQIFVIGPSGSGKSSLVAAGVLPRLPGAATRVAGSRFAVRTIRPGERPAQRLNDALGCDAGTLDGAVGRLVDQAGCDRLLVFIDQLEELFTLAEPPERGELVRALRVLRADRRCHLIAALRADFYGALMSSELWPDIDGRFTRLEVAPLRGPALREAIEAPARDAGVYLEHALVERLIGDAAAEPGALPLLQEALVLLWRHRSRRLLRLASYEALGSDGRSGLAVALARRADAVLHAPDFTSAQQLLARRIFLRLVSFGEGRPDTRRQQPRAALAGTGDDAAAVGAVIDRLIDERMLTSDASAGDATGGGEPLVDLSHEALIAGWPELQRWLQLRRDDEQRRRRLELHVADWVERGRSSVGLFDAIELGEAERWIAGETARELGYSGDLPRFLTASRQAIVARAERARLRRRRVWFARVAVTLTSISVALVIWRERQTARLRLGLNEQELARSLVIEHHDPETAIPHLIHAVELGVDGTVLRTLLSSARRDVWQLAIPGGHPVFSPDGTHLVTSTVDGVRMWDAATGSPVGLPLKHDKYAIASFSPDGARIVTTGSDGTARVWDAATGNPIGLPLKHDKRVASASFSPDGARIVTTGSDDTARVWDAATGNPIGLPLKHDKGVPSAAFSPDGARIVTASYDGTARIWDAATGNPVGLPIKHGVGGSRYALGMVYSAAFSPDGARVITAGEDARIWDATSGAPLGVLDAPPNGQSIQNAAFSPDGARIVTVSFGGATRVWDAATGKPVGLPFGEGIHTAAFSPDSTRIVTAGADSTARVWDATTGSSVGFPLRHDRGVSSAAFSPDGGHIVTCCSHGASRVWNVSIGHAIGLPLVLGGASRADSAAFSTDGARVVTASSGGAARVWDGVTGHPIGLPIRHDNPLHSFLPAFSSDGARVITAGLDGARVWDTATGHPIGLPLKHDVVLSAAFSPDGSRVLTASEDGTGRLWDSATGHPVGVPLKHLKITTSAMFSLDGARVVTVGDDDTARVWDTTTGHPLVVLGVPHRQGIKSAAFSFDGARIVTFGDDGIGVDSVVRVWDAATGVAIGHPLLHEHNVNSAAFSPDSARIVSASADHTARVWDAATGNSVGLPLRHDQEVRSAAFSPDGTRVVTASWDGTARVWDAATGNPVGLPLTHDRGVTMATFSPDGARVVTTDGLTAHVWNVAETGALSAWVEQAAKCMAQEPGAGGSSLCCPLSRHEAMPADQLARARSFVAAGDLAMFSRVWTAPRSAYQRAIALLDPEDGSGPWVHRDADDLRRVVSLRTAMLDAIEDHLRDARAHFGADAPRTDALLLNALGRLAHDELNNDDVALALLGRALERAPDNSDILANLAEVYFAAGHDHDFALTVGKIEQSRSSDLRVAMTTLAWAAARLAPTSDGPAAVQLVRAYTAIANSAVARRTWKGTKHALAYGHYRYAQVKPILDVLTQLEEPVTDKTRAQLAELLRAHNPTPSPKQ